MNSLYYVLVFLISSMAVATVDTSSHLNDPTNPDESDRVYITAPIGEGEDTQRLLSIELSVASMYERTWMSIYDEKNRRVIHRTPTKNEQTTYFTKANEAGDYYTSSIQELGTNTLDYFLHPNETYKLYFHIGDNPTGTAATEFTITPADFWNLDPENDGHCPSIVIANFSNAIPAGYFEETPDVSIYKNENETWVLQYANESIFEAISELHFAGANGKTKHWTAEGHLKIMENGTPTFECVEDIPNSGQALDAENWSSVTMKIPVRIVADASVGVTQFNGAGEANQGTGNALATTVYTYYEATINSISDRINFDKIEMEEEEGVSITPGVNPPNPWNPADKNIQITAENNLIYLDFTEGLSKRSVITIFDNQDRLVIYRQPNIDNNGVIIPAKFITFDYEGTEVFTESQENLVNFFSLDAADYMLYVIDIEDNSKDSYAITSDFLNAVCSAYWIEDFDKTDIPDSRFNDPEGEQVVINAEGQFALDFDGANDYLNLGSQNIGGFEMSLGTWFKLDNQEGEQFLMGIPGGAAISLSNGVPQLEMNVGGTLVDLSAEFNLPINTWFHLMGTFDGQNVGFYLNGELLASQTQSGTLQASDSLLVGGNIDSHYFDGQLDETTLWSVGLSQDEVQQKLDVRIDKDDEDLLAYLDYNQGAPNAIAQDVSNHGFDADFRNLNANEDWVKSDRPDYPQTDGNDYAINYIGETDHILVAETEKLDEVLNDFTIAFWAKVATTPEGNPEILRKPAAWGIAADNGTDLQIITYDDDCTFSNALLVDDAWHHYSFIGIAGTERKLYVDGVLHSTNDEDYTVVNSDFPLYIGNENGDMQPMLIDDVNIWKVAREDDDIYLDYASQKVDVNDVNLIAYYDFNGAPGQWLAQDASKNNHLGLIQSGDYATAFQMANKPEPSDIAFDNADFLLKNGNADSLTFYTLAYENIRQLYLYYRLQGESQFRTRWWTEEGVYYEKIGDADAVISCAPIPTTESVILAERFTSYTTWLEDKEGKYYRMAHNAPNPEGNFRRRPQPPVIFTAPHAKISRPDNNTLQFVLNKENLGQVVRLALYDNQDRLVAWQNREKLMKFRYKNEAGDGVIRTIFDETLSGNTIQFAALDYLEENRNYTLYMGAGNNRQAKWTFRLSDLLDNECEDFWWLLDFQDLNESIRFRDPDLPHQSLASDYVMDFSGNAHRIFIEDSDQLDLGLDFTIEFWAKTSSQNGWSNFLRKNADLLVGSAISDGTWHHYAITGNGGTERRLYVDGMLQEIDAGAYAMDANDSPLILGSSQDSPRITFDEVRLWNNTRIEPQIFEDYIYGIDVEEAGEGLVAYYTFDKGPGSWLVPDQSGNGNTGVLQNMNADSRYLESDKNDIDPEEAYAYKAINEGGATSIEGNLDLIEKIYIVRENGKRNWYSRKLGILYTEGNTSVNCVDISANLGEDVQELWIQTGGDDPRLFGLADVSGKFLPPQPESVLPMIELPSYIEVNTKAAEDGYIFSYDDEGLNYDETLIVSIWEEPADEDPRLRAYWRPDSLEIINYTDGYPDLLDSQPEGLLTVTLGDIANKVLYAKRTNGDTYRVPLSNTETCFTHALVTDKTSVEAPFFNLYGIYTNHPDLFEQALTSRNGRTFVETTYAGITGNNARSVEAWIKTATPSRAMITWGTGDTGGEWKVMVNQGGKLQVGNGTAAIRGVTTLTDDEWHHIAVVFGGGTFGDIQLYVDGLLEETQTQEGETTVNTASTGEVEVASDNGERIFKGLMEEVRIWSRALTREDILMSKGRELLKEEEKVGLELYYDFNEAESGTTIVDHSGNGRDGAFTSRFDFPFAVSLINEEAILEGNFDYIRDMYVVEGSNVTLYSNGSKFDDNNNILECASLPENLGSAVTEVWIRTYQEQGLEAFENFREYYQITNFDAIFLSGPPQGVTIDVNSNLKEEIIRLGSLEVDENGFDTGITFTFSDESLAPICTLAIYDEDNNRLIAYRSPDKNLSLNYSDDDFAPILRTQEAAGFFEIPLDITDNGNYTLFATLGNGKDAEWSFKGNQLVSDCSDFKWLRGLSNLSEPDWFLDPELTVAEAGEKSLHFSGLTSTVRLDPIQFTSPLTIETWVKVKPSSLNKNILRGQGDGRSMNLYYGNGSLNWSLSQNEETVNIGGLIALADEDWHHLALVYDEGNDINNTILYVDGVPLAEGNTGIITNLEELNIGPFMGEAWMDELIIWNTARSRTDIQTTYLNGFNASLAANNTLAYYSFDEGNTAILHDQSGHANIGLLDNISQTNDWVTDIHENPPFVRFDKSPYELVKSNEGISLVTRSTAFENTFEYFYFAQTPSGSTATNQYLWRKTEGTRYEVVDGVTDVICEAMPNVSEIFMSGQPSTFNAWIKDEDNNYFSLIQNGNTGAYYNFEPAVVGASPAIMTSPKYRLTVSPNHAGIDFITSDQSWYGTSTIGIYDTDNDRVIAWRSPEKNVYFNFESSAFNALERTAIGASDLTIPVPFSSDSEANYAVFIQNETSGTKLWNFAGSQISSSCVDFQWLFLEDDAIPDWFADPEMDPAGTTDYALNLDEGQSILLDHFERPDEFTISVWVQLADVDVLGDIFSWKSTANDLAYSSLKVAGDEDKELKWEESETGKAFVRGDYSGLGANWRHITITKDASGTAKLYMEGDLNRTATISKNPTTNYLKIGGNGFRGKLKNLAIWNQAKTATEVYNHYVEGIDPTIEGASLLAYYDFNDGPTEWLVRDKSGNEHTGTVIADDNSNIWAAGDLPGAIDVSMITGAAGLIANPAGGLTFYTETESNRFKEFFVEYYESGSSERKIYWWSDPEREFTRDENGDDIDCGSMPKAKDEILAAGVTAYEVMVKINGAYYKAGSTDGFETENMEVVSDPADRSAMDAVRLRELWGDENEGNGIQFEFEGSLTSSQFEAAVYDLTNNRIIGYLNPNRNLTFTYQEDGTVTEMIQNEITGRIELPLVTNTQDEYRLFFRLATIDEVVKEGTWDFRQADLKEGCGAHTWFLDFEDLADPEWFYDPLSPPVEGNFALDRKGRVPLPLTHFERPNEFTLEAWVKITEPDQFGDILRWEHSTGNQYITLEYNDNQLLNKGFQFIERPGTGTAKTTMALLQNAPYSSSDWHHVALTASRSTGAVKVYIRGAEIATGTCFASLVTDKLYLGNFGGIIDELAIWNRVKTKEEILDDMIYGIDAAEADLELYYQMNAGPGQLAMDDLSSNNYDFALASVDVNTIWVESDRSASIDINAAATVAFGLMETADLGINFINNSDKAVKNFYLVASDHPNYTTKSIVWYSADDDLGTPCQYKQILTGGQVNAASNGLLNQANLLGMAPPFYKSFFETTDGKYYQAEKFSDALTSFNEVPDRPEIFGGNRVRIRQIENELTFYFDNETVLNTAKIGIYDNGINQLVAYGTASELQTFNLENTGNKFGIATVDVEGKSITIPFDLTMDTKDYSICIQLEDGTFEVFNSSSNSESCTDLLWFLDFDNDDLPNWFEDPKAVVSSGGDEMLTFFDPNLRLHIQPSEDTHLQDDFSMDFWVYRQSGDFTINKSNNFGFKFTEAGEFLLMNTDESNYWQTSILQASREWHHYAITGNYGTVLNLYEDGILIGSFTGNYSKNAESNYTSHIEIGINTIPALGKLESLRFWNRQLSETEILNYVFLNQTDSEEGLTLHYKFDEGKRDINGCIVIDHTGRGNYGILDTNNEYYASSDLTSSDNYAILINDDFLGLKNNNGILIHGKPNVEIKGLFAQEGLSRDGFAAWKEDGTYIRSIDENIAIGCENIPPLSTYIPALPDWRWGAKIGIQTVDDQLFSGYIIGGDIVIFDKVNSFGSGYYTESNDPDHVKIIALSSGEGYKLEVLPSSLETNLSFAIWDESDADNPNLVVLKNQSEFYVIAQNENGFAELPQLQSSDVFSLPASGNYKLYLKGRDFKKYAHTIENLNCFIELLDTETEVDIKKFNLNSNYFAELRFNSSSNQYESVGEIDNAKAIYATYEDGTYQYFNKSQQFIYNSADDTFVYAPSFDFSFAASVQQIFAVAEGSTGDKYHHLPNPSDKYFVQIPESTYTSFVNLPDLSTIYAVITENNTTTLQGDFEDIEALLITKTDNTQVYFTTENSLSYNLNTYELGCQPIPTALEDNVSKIQIKRKEIIGASSNLLVLDNLEEMFFNEVDAAEIEGMTMPAYFQIQSFTSSNIGINLTFSDANLSDEITLAIWENYNGTERQVAHRADGVLKTIAYDGAVPALPVMASNNNVVSLSDLADKILYVEYNDKKYRFDIEETKLSEDCYYLPLTDNDDNSIDEEKLELMEVKLYDYYLTLDSDDRYDFIQDIPNVEELIIHRSETSGYRVYQKMADSEAYFYYSTNPDYPIACKSLPDDLGTLVAGVWVKMSENGTSKYYSITDMSDPILGLSEVAASTFPEIVVPNWILLKDAGDNHVNLSYQNEALENNLTFAFWAESSTLQLFYELRTPTELWSIAYPDTDTYAASLPEAKADLNKIDLRTFNKKVLYAKDENNEVYRVELDKDDLSSSCYLVALDDNNKVSSPADYSDKFELAELYDFSLSLEDANYDLVGNTDDVESIIITKTNGDQIHYTNTSDKAFNITQNQVLCESIPTTFGEDISAVWLKTNDKIYGLKNLTDLYFTEQSTTLFDNATVPPYFQIQAQTEGNTSLDLTFNATLPSDDLTLTIWEKQPNGSEQIMAHLENDVLNIISYNFGVPAPPVQADSPNSIALNNLNNKKLYIKNGNGETFVFSNLDYTNDCGTLVLTSDKTSTIDDAKFELPAISYAYSIEINDDNVNLIGAAENIAELLVSKTTGEEIYYNSSLGIAYNLGSEAISCESLPTNLGADISKISLKTTDGTFYGIDNLGTIYLIEESSSDIGDVSIPDYFFITNPTAGNTGMDLDFPEQSLAGDLTIALWETTSDNAERLVALWGNGEFSTITYNAAGYPAEPITAASTNNFPFEAQTDKTLYIQQSIGGSTKNYQFNLSDFALNADCQLINLANQDNSIADSKFVLPEISYPFAVNISNNTVGLVGETGDIQTLFVKKGDSEEYYQIGTLNYYYDVTNGVLDCRNLPADFGTGITEIFVKTTTNEVYGITDLNSEYLTPQTATPLDNISIPDYLEVNLNQDNTGTINFPTGLASTDFTISIWDNAGKIQSVWSNNDLSSVAYFGESNNPTPIETAANITSIPVESSSIIFIKRGTDLAYTFDLASLNAANTCDWLTLSSANETTLGDDKFTLPDVNYAYSLSLDATNGVWNLTGNQSAIEALYIVRDENGDSIYYQKDSELAFNISQNSILCESMPTSFSNNFSEIWLKTNEETYQLVDLANEYFLNRSTDLFNNTTIPPHFQLKRINGDLTFIFNETISATDLIWTIWGTSEGGTERILAHQENEVLNTINYTLEIPAPPIQSTTPNVVDYGNLSNKKLYVKNGTATYETNLADLDVAGNCTKLILNSTTSSAVSEDKFILPDISYTYSLEQVDGKLKLVEEVTNIEALYIVGGGNDIRLFQKYEDTYLWTNSAGDFECRELRPTLGDISAIESVWLKTNEGGTTKYYGATNPNQKYLPEVTAADLPTIRIPNLLKLDFIGDNDAKLTYIPETLEENLTLALWGNVNNPRLLSLRTANQLKDLNYDGDILEQVTTQNNLYDIDFRNLVNKTLYVRDENNTTYRIPLDSEKLVETCYLLPLTANFEQDGLADKFDIESLFDFSVDASGALQGALPNISAMIVIDENGDNIYYETGSEVAYNLSQNTILCESMPTTFSDNFSEIWLKTTDQTYQLTNLADEYFINKATSLFDNVAIPPHFQLQRINGDLNFIFNETLVATDIIWTIWGTLANGTERILAHQENEVLNTINYATGLPAPPNQAVTPNVVRYSDLSNKKLYVKNGTATYEINLADLDVAGNCTKLMLNVTTSSTVSEDRFVLPDINYAYSLEPFGGNWNLIGDQANIEELYLVRSESGIRFFQKFGDKYLWTNTNTGAWSCRNLPPDLSNDLESVWLKTNENGIIKYYGANDPNQIYLTAITATDLPQVNIPNLLQLDFTGEDHVNLTYVTEGLEEDLTLAFWGESTNPKLLALRTANELKTLTYNNHIPNQPVAQTDLNDIDLRTLDNKVLYVKNSDNTTYRIPLDSENLAGACYLLPLTADFEQTGIAEKFDIGALYDYSVNESGTLQGAIPDISEMIFIRASGDTIYYNGNLKIAYNFSEKTLQCSNSLLTSFGNNFSELWLKTTDQTYQITNLAGKYFVNKTTDLFNEVPLPPYFQLERVDGDINFVFNKTLASTDIIWAIWETTPDGTKRMIAHQENEVLNFINYNADLPLPPTQAATPNVVTYTDLSKKTVYVKKGTETYGFNLAFSGEVGNCIPQLILNSTTSIPVSEDKFILPNINYAYSLEQVDSKWNLIGNQSNIEALYIVRGTNEIHFFQKYNDKYLWTNTNTGDWECQDLPPNLDTTVESVWLKTNENGSIKYYGASDPTQIYLTEVAATDLPQVSIPNLLRLDASTENQVNLAYVTEGLEDDLTLAFWEEGNDPKLLALRSSDELKTVSYISNVPIQINTKTDLNDIDLNNLNNKVLYVKTANNTIYQINLDSEKLAANCYLLPLTSNDEQTGLADKFELPSLIEYSSNVFAGTYAMGNAKFYEAIDYQGITEKGSRTLEAWIKTDVRGKSLIQWGTNEDGKAWSVILDGPTGALRVIVQRGTAVGTIPLDDNQWHHIAIVLEDDGDPNINEVKFYVDGKVETLKRTVNRAIDTGLSKVRIGSDTTTGEIDEVRIWNIARSQEAILNTISDELTGNETGLQLYYNFNDLSGIDLTDNSDKNRDALLQLLNAPYAYAANKLNGNLEDIEIVFVERTNGDIGIFDKTSGLFFNATTNEILCQDISADLGGEVQKVWLTANINNTIRNYGLEDLSTFFLTEKTAAQMPAVSMPDYVQISPIRIGTGIKLAYPNTISKNDVTFAIWSSVNGNPDKMLVLKTPTELTELTYQNDVLIGVDTRTTNLDNIEIADLNNVIVFVDYNGNIYQSSINETALNEDCLHYIFSSNTLVTGQADKFDLPTLNIPTAPPTANSFNFNSGSAYLLTDYKGVKDASARTIDCWIKTTKKNKIITSWGDDSGGGTKWVVKINGEGLLRAEVNQGYKEGKTMVNDGQWHHIAVVATDNANISNAKLFVDGVLEKNGLKESRLINTSNAGKVEIGSREGTAIFDGEIAEFRIWSKALLEWELLQNMGISLAGNEPNLELYFNFSEGNNAALYQDLTSKDRDAAVITGQKAPFNERLDLSSGTDHITTTYEGITGKKKRTVEAWVKTAESNTTILSWGTDAGNGKNWRIVLNSNGKLKVIVKGGAITGSTIVNDNQWHHIAIVSDDSQTPKVNKLKLYVDGQLEEKSVTTNQAINTATGGNLEIGSINGSNVFKGKIDEVRIWNKARTALEILSTMGTELTGNEDKLEAYYNFNSGSDPQDISGNNRHGTLESTIAAPPPVTTFDSNNGTNYISTNYKGISEKRARTFEAKIKTTTAGKTIAHWGNTSGNGKKFEIKLTNQGKLQVGVKGGFRTGSTVLNDGQWHHIAVVMSKDNNAKVQLVKLFVDGVQESYSGASNRVVNTADAGTLSIGAAANGANKFEGELDEIRLWNKVRTNNAINAKKDQELTGAEPGLQLYYDFNGLSGNTISDKSTKNRNGTIQ